MTKPILVMKAKNAAEANGRAIQAMIKRGETASHWKHIKTEQLPAEYRGGKHDYLVSFARLEQPATATQPKAIQYPTPEPNDPTIEAIRETYPTAYDYTSDGDKFLILDAEARIIGRVTAGEFALIIDSASICV